MTRDELLQRLRDISSSLEYDDAVKTTAESRDKEIKNIEQQRELLSFQIRDLQTKLADYSNYASFTLFRNQAKIYDLNSKLNKISTDIAQNEADITENDQRIDYINREIEAYNALLSEEQRNLEKYSYDLRSLGENPDSRQEQEILTKMASARESIAYLRSEFSIFSDELDGLNQAKENLLKRKDNLSSSQSRYQILLDSVKKRDEKDSQTKIDTVKKAADQRKLLQLQSCLESFNNRAAYISFDLPLEIDTLIADLENNRIDHEMALQRLQEFRALLPEQIANKDYTNVDEEVSENQHLQAEILMEKGTLEAKLADENNYLPSIFAVEIMDQEISTLEQTIARYDSDIKDSDTTLARYDGLRSNLEMDIEKTKKRNR